jgi:hypothetical protein
MKTVPFEPFGAFDDDQLNSKLDEFLGQFAPFVKYERS